MCEIAKRQLQAAERNPFDEVEFDAMKRRWEEERIRAEQLQLAVDALMNEDQLRNTYRNEVKELLLSIQPLIARSEQLISGQYASTGAAVKAVKDQRSLMSAYYGFDRDDSVPLYVNEKK